MKNLKKISRKELKSILGASFNLEDAGGEKKLYQCCKVNTYDCRGCQEGGCGSGYYTIYCGTNNPPKKSFGFEAF